MQHKFYNSEREGIERGFNKKSLRIRRLFIVGAGNETRTRDPNLGKVVLYQLSYSRLRALIIGKILFVCNR